MRTIFSYSIIALFVIAAACESNVTDVNLPEYKSKLVVSAFLCPSDTASYVFVNSTMKLYGDLSRMESLGTALPEIIISDDTKEVVLDTSRYGWKLDPRKMKIEYGKNYQIRVSTDKGYLAEASCTVPERRSFSIEVDTFSTIFNSFRYLQLGASFNDIPGEENFYRIKVELKSHCNSQKWQLQELPVEDHFISDLDQDGNRLKRSIKSGLRYGSFPSCDSVYIVLKLYHTEKSYYLYHKSLDNYQNGDNPFTEPTPVFSNVKGGVGIFTSYTIDSAVIRLK